MKNQPLYYKNNRLQQLRGFCYAAQFGNISRAAEQMGLTHSSVSLQIKALEKDLGVMLFRRRGPQINLTLEGKKLLDLALPHIGGIQNLHETFHRELQTAEKTELHISVNNTAKNYIMPPVVNAYLAANPDIYVALHYAEHDEATRLIAAGEIDFAVLPRREHMPFPETCDYIPVFTYTPSLITRRDHPLAGRANLSVEDIGGYELTLPPEDLRVIPNLYEIFPQHKTSKKLRLGFVNAETGREYIEAGLVVTIGSPCYLKENDILVATPLPHLFPDVDYGFVKKAGAPMPDKIRKMIEIARQRALAGKNAGMQGLYLVNIFLRSLQR